MFNIPCLTIYYKVLKVSWLYARTPLNPSRPTKSKYALFITTAFTDLFARTAQSSSCYLNKFALHFIQYTVQLSREDRSSAVSWSLSSQLMISSLRASTASYVTFVLLLLLNSTGFFVIRSLCHMTAGDNFYFILPVLNLSLHA